MVLSEDRTNLDDAIQGLNFVRKNISKIKTLNGCNL